MASEHPHLSSPPSATSMADAPLDALRRTVARLRAPDGCPWDREQTHLSLRGGLIEEAYETVEAIEEADDAHFCEELGDLLLQVVMHSQIASETGRFTLDEVITGLNAKLIRRHPHVFGDATAENQAADSAAVLRRWEEIKRQEKAAHPAVDSALDGVSGAFPALLHAEKITKKAARVGFDWATPQPVFEKVREELAETEEALQKGIFSDIEEEVGDLLFSVVNLARKLRVEPEVALRRADGKFQKRFRALEVHLQAQGKKPQDCTLEEMDAVWEVVKGKS